MEYIVMETHPGYAVVLDEKGEFTKVANLHYEVGETVTDVVPLQLPEVPVLPTQANRRRWMSRLTALAACLVLVLSNFFFGGNLPYASVYITINPQVRIDVDREDRVVGLEGVNEDGVTLISGYSFRHKNLDTVMDELVDRAIEMGFLKEGGTITLTLEADNEWVLSHESHLESHLKEHLQDHIVVDVAVSHGDDDDDHDDDDHDDDDDDDHDDDHDDEPDDETDDIAEAAPKNDPEDDVFEEDDDEASEEEDDDVPEEEDDDASEEEADDVPDEEDDDASEEEEDDESEEDDDDDSSEDDDDEE